MYQLKHLFQDKNKKMYKLKGKINVSILLVIFIGILEFMWAYFYYSYKKNGEGLLSVSSASVDLLGNVIQTFIVTIPSLLIFLIVLVIQKEKFLDKCRLYIRSKGSKVAVLILAILYLLELTGALFLYEDKISVIYQWLYYLIAIGGVEELMWRGVTPNILEEKVNEKCVWILPNAVFALLHILMPFINGSMNLVAFLNFLRLDFFYFLGFGLLMELLKRASKSLWVPILIHAIYNFLFLFF